MASSQPHIQTPNTPKKTRRASRAGLLHFLWFLLLLTPNTPKIPRRASRAGLLHFPMVLPPFDPEYPKNPPARLARRNGPHLTDIAIWEQLGGGAPPCAPPPEPHPWPVIFPGSPSNFSRVKNPGKNFGGVLRNDPGKISGGLFVKEITNVCEPGPDIFPIFYRIFPGCPDIFPGFFPGDFSPGMAQI